MSLDTLRSKVVDMFQTALVTSAFASTPVRYENHPFTEPKGPYMYVYTMPVDAKRAAIGTTQRYQKHIDMIVIECYVPEDSGTKTLNDMMSFATSVYEDSDFYLVDGERVIVKIGKQKVNGLQYGAFRGTVMLPIERRVTKA